MFKILITSFLFLFVVSNYNNIYNYYFLYAWNYEKALYNNKNDLNYYNMWVTHYNNNDYDEALYNFNLIEKKDYKTYFNLWNSYYYNSFYSDLTDNIISNLKLSVNNFSKSIELNKNELVLTNYNIALAELEKYEKKPSSNNEDFGLWAWDNIEVINKEWNKYILNIDDIINEITEGEKEEYIRYIDALK